MKTRDLFPADAWMPMSMYPPESCETYEAKMADGMVQRVFWSGKAWWLQGKLVTPNSWRVLQLVAA